MKKTLVTLDFDGTVSPIDQSRRFNEEDGWVTLDFGFQCAVHQSVIDFLQYLKKLSKAEDVRIVWASTWNEGTEMFFERSNGLIPDFEWINVSKGKDVEIRRKVIGGSFERLIVLEDQLKVMNSIKRSLRSQSDLDALFIKPKVTMGITTSHIEKVKEFLEVQS